MSKIPSDSQTEAIRPIHRIFHTSQSDIVRLGRRIGTGAEGEVYEIQDKSDLVAKVYHEPPPPEKAEKLVVLSRLGNERLFNLSAWPVSTLRDAPDGEVVGFVMKKISQAEETHGNDSYLCGVGAKRVALGWRPWFSQSKARMSFTPLPKPVVQVSKRRAFQRSTFRLTMAPSLSSSLLLFFPFRFPASHGIHRAVENNSVQRTSLSWRPSPCTELSSALSTMTPPTLTTNIAGLLGLSFRGEPPMFTRTNSNKIV
jgi:hypothetical protein